MGLETLPYKLDPNKDVKDLNEGVCDASICLIVDV